MSARIPPARPLRFASLASLDRGRRRRSRRKRIWLRPRVRLGGRRSNTHSDRRSDSRPVAARCPAAFGFPTWPYYSWSI